MIVRPGFVHTKMTEGLKAAPLSVGPDAVADAVVRGIARGREVVWVPPGHALRDVRAPPPPDPGVPAPPIVMPTDRRGLRFRRHDDPARHARPVPHEGRGTRKRCCARWPPSRRGSLLAAFAVAADRDAAKERVLTRVLAGRAHRRTSPRPGRAFGEALTRTAVTRRGPRPHRLAPPRGARGRDRVRVARRLPRRGRGASSGSRTLLCTSLDVDDDGRCTGLLRGANCRGAEKLHRLRAFRGRRRRRALGVRQQLRRRRDARGRASPRPRATRAGASARRRRRARLTATSGFNLPAMPIALPVHAAGARRPGSGASPNADTRPSSRSMT